LRHASSTPRIVYCDAVWLPKPSSARAETTMPVYGWFTLGFDARDLKEARILLDELHA
jgi:hypothetical protein